MSEMEDKKLVVQVFLCQTSFSPVQALNRLCIIARGIASGSVKLVVRFT